MNANHIQYPYIIPVLVTYSDTVQTLALKARKDLWKSPIPQVFNSSEEEAHVPSLQAELASGYTFFSWKQTNGLFRRVTFFIGAGVSQSSHLPSWGTLIHRICDKVSEQIDIENDNAETLLKAAERAKHLLGDR